MALFVVWATSQAGYPVTHWAPGGLIVLALLGVALGVVGLDVRAVPLPLKIAVGCLAGYTTLSFASILWAAVPGDAWEGANRTLLYLLVFALFALWPQRGRSAALLLGTWTLAMIALAVFVALHVNAEGGHLTRVFDGERLTYPTGYPNASAAQWLMAFWPALLLARSERLPWALRGVLAGGAVLLAEVALLSQSRGSLYATPVMLVLVFTLLPGRVRTFALLVPVAVGIGAAAPAVVHVGDRLQHGGNTVAALHGATTATFVAALVVGLIVAAAAAIEQRRAFPASTAAIVHRGGAALAVLTLVVILAGGVVATGNPLKRIEHGWHTFKVGYGADSAGGNHLVSGLGSNRYDFYRVALDEFATHPLVGIGADNFQQQYLVHGRSNETPHYPHSVELRTLTETGLIGTLLALAGLAAALLAAARGLRGSDPLGRAVVAAALAGFGYWVVHGSFDWFWEFAGLGAPAFALLGLACALAGRPRAGRARPRSSTYRAAGYRRLVHRWRRGRPVADGSVAEPAGGAERGARVDEGAANGIRPPERRGAAEPAQRRTVPRGREHRAALRRSRARGSRVRAGARAHAGRRLRHAGARGDRLDRERAPRRARAARAGRTTEPPGLPHRAGSATVREGKRVNVGELNRSILLNAQQLA